MKRALKKVHHFRPEEILLEQVAATLQELNLEWCGIRESQCESIHLPWATAQAWNFQSVGMSFLAILEKLLSHTTRMSNLSDQLNVNGRREDDPAGMLHCKGKCRLTEVLALLGICIYTITYAPQILELHVCLRPTCWNFPWVDVCKAIVRNKETSFENLLLPSLI